jgi:DNA end-binding protein Ku
MPRASWKGFLRLSLVSCPIYLSPASTRTKSIRLHQVWQPKVARGSAVDEDEEDGPPDRDAGRLRNETMREDADPDPSAPTRVALVPHDPYTGEAIDREEVVKGYEVERGRFVTFTAAELKALDVESSKIIDLDTFVPRAEVDPVYFSTPYYVYPDGGMALETFRVIGAAMEEAGAVGIGRVTLSRRERPVMVEPRGAGMALITLRAAEEVRAASFDNTDGDIDPDMVAIAATIIRRRSGSFDPATFRDRLPGGAARTHRGKGEGPASQAETDRGTAPGRGSDGRAEAQPGERVRHDNAKAQSRRRSPAGEPVAAGGRKEKGDRKACACDGPAAAPPESLIWRQLRAGWPVVRINFHNARFTLSGGAFPVYPARLAHGGIPDRRRCHRRSLRKRRGRCVRARRLRRRAVC